MESIAIYTGKDIDAMRKDGGSGHWVVNVPRVKKAEYLVCVRNRREQWSIADHKHGTAFMIARVSGATTISPYAGRTVIGLTEYAEFTVVGAWKKLTDGQRFPVAYMSTESMLGKLELNIASLDWKPFEASQASDIDTNSAADDVQEAISPIAMAKHQLAKALGISPDTIEIIIRA